MNVKLINKEKEEELKELREQSINIINDKEMVGWYIELQTVDKDYHHNIIYNKVKDKGCVANDCPLPLGIQLHT